MDDLIDRVERSLSELLDGNSDFRNRVDERLDDFEKRLNRHGLPDWGEPSGKKSLRYRAFESLLRYGPERLQPDERMAALVSSDDTKGGYLAPPEYVKEVLAVIPEYSPIRKLALIGATSSGEVLIPKRTATGTAFWVGETETRSEIQPAYGQERLVVNEAGGYVDMSVQTLEDSAIDAAAEVAQCLGQEFGRLEGLSALLGSGSKQPEGVLTNSAITAVPSGSASSITADGLISMYYALPAYYRNRSAWLCNGSCLAGIRKLKDGNGQYLWQPGLAQDRPDTLLSRPVIEAVDAPDIAPNATPLILGAWKDGYRIYDRVYLSILRDNFTQALNGKVRFWARRRVAMGVVLPEAFRKLKISVS